MNFKTALFPSVAALVLLACSSTSTPDPSSESSQAPNSSQAPSEEVNYCAALGKCVGNASDCCSGFAVRTECPGSLSKCCHPAGACDGHCCFGCSLGRCG
jgi:hypothetical protein